MLSAAAVGAIDARHAAATGGTGPGAGPAAARLGTPRTLAHRRHAARASRRHVSTTVSGFSEIDSMPCSTSHWAKST